MFTRVSTGAPDSSQARFTSSCTKASSEMSPSMDKTLHVFWQSSPLEREPCALDCPDASACRWWLSGLAVFSGVVSSFGFSELPGATSSPGISGFPWTAAPLLFNIILSVSCSPAASRSAQMVIWPQPAAARARAVARPMPREAPVTIALHFLVKVGACEFAVQYLSFFIKYNSFSPGCYGIIH